MLIHSCLGTLVAQSKCPTLVGHSGIVIKDTEHMFFLVTKENQLKKVPKCNCVFTMPVGTERVFTLYGNQLRTRPADRATKKYKNRLTVELP